MIICAAIRDSFGNIHSLPKPNRHSHIIDLIISKNIPISGREEGFLNDKGEFLSREKAWEEAHRNKQILPPYNPINPNERRFDLKPSEEPGPLFSEDLW